MEYYEFTGDNNIPNNYRKDVISLRRFIFQELNIYLSLIDTYKLWSVVSDSWDAGWLSIEAHYENQTREEFLRYQIEKYCRKV